MSVNDYYSSAPSNIWTVSAEGGSPERVTSSGKLPGSQHFPSWSADGSEIRFVNWIGTTSEVWAYSLRAHGFRKLATSQDWRYGGAAFSPDNRWLYMVTPAVNGDSRILRLALDPKTSEVKGAPVQVFRPSNGAPRDLVISSDGTRVAYSVILSRSEIQSIPIGTNLQPVGGASSLTREVGFRYAQPALSPDGELLAYTSWRKADKGGIWVAKSNGSEPRLIGPESSDNFFPRFIADGTAVMYASAENRIYRVMATTLGDGATRLVSQLKGGGAFPTLSPDGTAVCFNQSDSGLIQVWKQDLLTGELTQLTFGDVSIGYPRYSPDGKWLALALQPVGNSFVAVMPADGGKPETIYDRPGASYSYGWSPDSDKVLFAGFHNGAWNLYWVSRSSKKVQKLSDYTSMRTYVRYPEWSPTGKQIVYEFNESKGNVFIAEIR
jgi:Tol biopolymer transport system component